MATEIDVNAKALANFYKRKGKEPAGGHMYQIHNKGRVLRTMWGRSKPEVEKFLNKIRCRFDKVIQNA